MDSPKPAFGCEAVVNPTDAVYLTYRNLWFYDCYAASATATYRITA
jgi:hypothetical protein